MQRPYSDPATKQNPKVRDERDSDIVSIQEIYQVFPPLL